MPTTATARSTKNKPAAAATMPKPKAKKRSSAEVFKSLDMTPDWEQVPELVQLDFGDYAERRQKLSDEIQFRKDKLKELDEEIMSQLAVSGLEKVTWQDRPIQIVHSKSGSKVVPEKLLMLGVPADTIAQATEPGKPYDYLLFGKTTKS